MPIDDGGAAFPQQQAYGSRADSPGPGMTLRDYFAAKAMQAMCAGPGAKMVAERDELYDGTNWADVVARNAYDFSDAMLAARKAGAA